MSMSSSNSSCSLCEKGEGIVRCEGCMKIFCFEHLFIHRQELDKNLDNIQTSYNITYESVAQQLIDPSKHPLLEKIDRWEEDAIAKIRAEAEISRKAILRQLVGNVTALRTQLEELNSELQGSRHSNGYLEGDLNVWQEKLKRLKGESTNPTTLGIRDDSSTLISKLRVDIKELSETFDRSFGITTFEDNGTPAQQNPYASPTNYAWSTRHEIYQVGTASGVEQNDIIHLGIDCDQRTIRLFNERSKHTLQMQVDVNKCPFPWQLHLNLHASSTKVRILE